MIKSGLFLSLSRFAEKILSFFVVVVACRIYGNSGMGEFYFYFSLVSLAIPLMDAGFEKLYISYRQEANQGLLTELLVAKLCMGIVALTALSLACALLPSAGNFKALFACFLAIFSDEIGQLLRSPARAVGQHLYEILAPILARVVTFFLLLNFQSSLLEGYQLAYCYAVANLLTAFLSIMGAGSEHISIRQLPTPRKALQWIRRGMPFSLTHLFVMTSLFADSVILGQYSLPAVGLYNAAYRVILVLGALSFGACHVLFPVLSRLREDDAEEVRQALLRDVVRLFLLLFGGVFFLSLTVGAEWMPIVYGADFQLSMELFRLLSPLVILISLTNLIGQTLEALGHQNWVWRINLSAACLNIMGNLAMIPWFLGRAAAWTTVLSEAFVLSCFLAVTSGQLFPRNGWYLGRIMTFYICSGSICGMAWATFPVQLATFLAVAQVGVLFLLGRSYWLPNWCIEPKRGRVSCAS